MKISVYIATSLDGYIARENHSLDWLPGAGSETETGNDEQGHEDFGYADFMNSVDTLVMGKNTFNTVLSLAQHWPYENKQVIVLSTQLKQIPDHLANTVKVKNIPPKQLITELQTSGSQHIYLDGGKTIQAFLNAGLVNDLILTRIPILIGSGIPLFGKLEQDIKLQHLSSKSYENGLVQSHYKIIDPKPLIL